jgi:hypothetical protein
MRETARSPLMLRKCERRGEKNSYFFPKAKGWIPEHALKKINDKWHGKKALLN